MMRRSALVLTLFVAGCAGLPDTGSPSASGPDVVGRTFLSTGVSGYTLAGGSRIELTFPEAGKLSANTGCNHLLGDAVFEGDRLKVSGMSGTDMACDQARMVQDEWFIKFMTAGPTWMLAGDDLTLKGGTTEIKLKDRKAADPDRPLTGRRWVVDTLMDSEATSSVPQGAQAYLEFENGKVTGNTGCNSLNGSYTEADEKITFSGMATTRMACPGPQGELERAVVAVLEGPVDAKITANKLVLRHPSGRGLSLTS